MFTPEIPMFSVKYNFLTFIFDDFNILPLGLGNKVRLH